MVIWNICNGTFEGEVQVHDMIRGHYRLGWKVTKLKRKKPLAVQDRQVLRKSCLGVSDRSSLGLNPKAGIVHSLTDCSRTES